ncbi:hypothetical protein B1773_01255 [Dehalococcoides mccartyi]|jgi:hypothetical protein|uniref:hypothetical protein n=1 Tax=Dehalococcoides mccartyi TaxID=61435 RepID=UPI00098FC163|nr:hypothetical protein [Dehalococcoides mccartyi]AQU02717.1 hypothetical protein B1773_01255 [Dehalococcoides mccartyi]
MGKYASWNELERNVPLSYREGATPEAFRSGMQGIAPAGMSVKEGRVSAYGRGVDGKAEVMVERYRRAMFE